MTRLKAVRQSKGFSQSQLAERSKVNVRTIQKYEQGTVDLNKAQVSAVYQLAQALECTVEELIK